MKGNADFVRRTWWRIAPPRPFAVCPYGEVVASDAFIFLEALRDACADIVFLDPPFNLGKRYGRKGNNADRLRDDEYFGFMSRVLGESVRILKEGGALYLYHIPRWAFRFAPVISETLQFRHWIAISMKNGFVRQNYLYPAHYALLYFTKGQPASFKRPKIAPATCPRCQSYVKDYGGYKRFIQAGINLSDVWDDLSPVRHRKYKHRKANELPLEIPRRAIEISGRPSGLLVDPFAGSGSTLVAGLEVGMFFAACDRERGSCSRIAKRILKAISSLKEKEGESNARQ